MRAVCVGVGVCCVLGCLGRGRGCSTFRFCFVGVTFPNLQLARTVFLRDSFDEKILLG